MSVRIRHIIFCSPLRMKLNEVIKQAWQEARSHSSSAALWSGYCHKSWVQIPLFTFLWLSWPCKEMQRGGFSPFGLLLRLCGAYEHLLSRKVLGGPGLKSVLKNPSWQMPKTWGVKIRLNRTCAVKLHQRMGKIWEAVCCLTLPLLTWWAGFVIQTRPCCLSGPYPPS